VARDVTGWLSRLDAAAEPLAMPVDGVPVDGVPVDGEPPAGR
jgi:hypothetical protein